MAQHFSNAGSRDEKIDQLIKDKKAAEAAEFLFSEITASLNEDQIYSQISTEYTQFCDAPIKQVIEKSLKIREDCLLAENAKQAKWAQIEGVSFTERIIDHAATAASVAMAKHYITSVLVLDLDPESELDPDLQLESDLDSELEPESETDPELELGSDSDPGSETDPEPDFDSKLVAEFFRMRILPRLKYHGSGWTNRKGVRVDWKGEKGSGMKGIMGRDLVDYAILEIWRYSVPKFREDLAYEWVQFYMVNCAKWAFHAFLRGEEKWVHPSVHYLTLDIEAFKARSIESSQKIVESLKKYYLSVYQERCADGSKPQMKELRCQGIPDLSYWSKKVKTTDHLPEDKFEELLNTVITEIRINNIIDKWNLRNTVSLNAVNFDITVDSSSFLKKIMGLLKEVHDDITPQVLKNPGHRKAFEMMWEHDDDIISEHPDVPGEEANVRKMRSRAIEGIERRLNKPDMKDLTDKEREAMLWMYMNFTPPYRYFSRRRKGAKPPPDRWLDNLESGSKKLKNNLRNNPNNN